jgi:hypothetical protein
MEVLDEFLPDCGDTMVHRGYAAPEYCEVPEKDVCASCQANGKRPPGTGHRGRSHRHQPRRLRR